MDHHNGQALPSPAPAHPIFQILLGKNPRGHLVMSVRLLVGGKETEILSALIDPSSSKGARITLDSTLPLGFPGDGQHMVHSETVEHLEHSYHARMLGGVFEVSSGSSEDDEDDEDDENKETT